MQCILVVHGVGAGTLTNLCSKIAKVNSFEDIFECAKNGNLKNVDLKIRDVTNTKIETLPQDVTLANFGNLNENASQEDLVLGIVNMVFEVIGMMAVFALKNDSIKDVILIGNIVSIPRIEEILDRIKTIHNINFILPNDPGYGTAIGAIKSI